MMLACDALDASAKPNVPSKLSEDVPLLAWKNPWIMVLLVSLLAAARTARLAGLSTNKKTSEPNVRPKP